MKLQQWRLLTIQACIRYPLLLGHPLLLCCSPSGLSVLSLVRHVVFVESESGYLAGCKTLGISLSLSLALRRVVESVGATGS